MLDQDTLMAVVLELWAIGAGAVWKCGGFTCHTTVLAAALCALKFCFHACQLLGCWLLFDVAVDPD